MWVCLIWLFIKLTPGIHRLPYSDMPDLSNRTAWTMVFAMPAAESAGLGLLFEIGVLLRIAAVLAVISVIVYALMTIVGAKDERDEEDQGVPEKTRTWRS